MSNHVTTVVATEAMSLDDESFGDQSEGGLLELVANGRMVCGLYSIACLSIQRFDSSNVLVFDLVVSKRNKLDQSYSWMVEECISRGGSLEGATGDAGTQQCRNVKLLQLMKPWKLHQQQVEDDVASFVAFLHCVRLFRMRWWGEGGGN